MQQLYALERGNPDGPPVVFLHGGGLAGWMWHPQAEQLSEYRCLLVDMPETAQSQQVGPFTMANAAAAVADFIRERVPGGKAHVVGLSLGAQVGLQLLADNPSVVQRAVLSGPMVVPMRGSWFYGRVMRWMLPIRHTEFGLRLNLKQLGLPDDFLADIQETMATTSDDALMRMVAENQRFRVPPGLDRCDVPTLIVAGGKEAKVMLRSVHAAVADFPCAVGAFATDLGHVWNLEDPARFSGLVRAWLTDGPWPDGIDRI